jgi:RNA polymerase-binding transcription factor DksA
MDKKILKKLKEALEREEKEIEENLKRFAKKDLKLPDDWDTKFPKFDGETGLEIAADEVEEYAARLPVEFALELRLKDIKRALEKMKKRKYGICEKCKREIERERLKANPAAKLCLKCKDAL